MLSLLLLMPMLALAQIQRKAEILRKRCSCTCMCTHVFNMCGVQTCAGSDAAGLGYEQLYYVLEFNTIVTQVATDVLNVILNINYNVDAIFIRPKQRPRSDSMLPSKKAAGLSSTLRGCMAPFQMIWGLACAP